MLPRPSPAPGCRAPRPSSSGLPCSTCGRSLGNPVQVSFSTHEATPRRSFLMSLKAPPHSSATGTGLRFESLPSVSRPLSFLVVNGILRRGAPLGDNRARAPHARALLIYAPNAFLLPPEEEDTGGTFDFLLL